MIFKIQMKMMKAVEGWERRKGLYIVRLQHYCIAKRRADRNEERAEHTCIHSRHFLVQGVGRYLMRICLLSNSELSRDEIEER